MKSTSEMTKAFLGGGLVLLLVFTLVGHAVAQSYDAFVDFSFASNPTPDGLWRYGFTPPGADGPLTLYTHRDSPLGLSAWRDATDPNVIKNETGNDILVFGAILFPATEFLHFHPGPSGERSVVRWTAPAAGAYQIAADFRGLRNDSCGQTVDVHVLHNGTELYRADISSGRDVRSFLGTQAVDVGDTVDFQVGRGPDSYVCDSTGLKATIMPLDTVTTVTIDIKPGSDPNSINPKSKGKIPAAILTTDTFDATTVDPTTILFGATGNEAAPVRSALEDVDGDGDTDMILHFNTQDTGIQCGDTSSASLTGETFDGQMIEGSDSVKTAGCK